MEALNRRAPLEMPRRAWPLVLGMLLVIAAFADSGSVLVKGWLVSESYLHGFIVVPLALWLIWLRRAELERTQGSPSPYGFIALTALCALWAAGRTVHVQIVEQVALVAMLPAVVWAIAGGECVRLLAFPLAYLALAIPTGGGLLHPLMSFTADCVAIGLRLVGVAVFRDGYFISTPAGDFLVAEACSGLRYLLASVAIGSIYAYLQFRTLRARAIIMALSLVIPIIANGARAFTIVLIAQIWGMDAASGLDHFIYGWIFFGLVIALLIFVGSRIKEKSPATGAQKAADHRHAPSSPARSVYLQIAAAALLLGLTRYGVALGEREEPQFNAEPPRLPRLQAGWRGPESPSGRWAPNYAGATFAVQGRFRSGSGNVDVSVVRYARQRQGRELVNYDNEVFDPAVWRFIRMGNVEAAEQHWPARALREVQVATSNSGRLIWYWFDIGGRQTTSRLGAKLLELQGRLTGRQDATLIALSAEFFEGPQAARTQLADLLSKHGAMFSRCIGAEAPAADSGSCVEPPVSQQTEVAGREPR